jgi:hypothetical protein
MNTANIESIVEEFETRTAEEGVSIFVVTVSERHTGFWVGCRPGADRASAPHGLLARLEESGQVHGRHVANAAMPFARKGRGR